MKTLFSSLSCLFLVFTSLSSHAALYDRGNGLIYDDVLDITWLQDANYAKTSGYDFDGRLNWYDALEFVDQLEIGSFTEWKLPSAGDPPVMSYNNDSGESGETPIEVNIA